MNSRSHVFDCLHKPIDNFQVAFRLEYDMKYD